MGLLRHALLPAVAAISLLTASVTPAFAGAPARDGWAAKAWLAAAQGDRPALDEAFRNAPPTLGPETALGKSIRQLLEHTDAREAKRAEDITRVRADLTRILAGKADDLSLSMGLRSAIELSMLSTDKNALLEEQQVTQLIADADAAARKAEDRGDWMMASELYYRLDLLLEEKGTYRDDVKRESQRLSMIRLYAPKRLWELKNTRRNAELEWRAKQPKKEGDKEAKDDNKPLPPYNPMGDDFRDKLKGIDELMISRSLNRGFERHVERTTMDKILRGGVEAIRTLVTTDDLKAIFPGLADAEAKTAFLAFLDGEDERLAQVGRESGAGDLHGLIQRLTANNDRTVKLPREALLHEFGNGGTAALDEFSSIIWPDEVARFERNTQGRFVGVGVQIEHDPLQNIRIVTPLDGTPAQKAGIRPGDLIKKVNGISTIGFTLDQAVDVITGMEDTQVTLTLERETPQADGPAKREEIDFKLTRSRIEVVTVKGWKRTGIKEDDWDWFIDPVNKIGYIRLTQFADRTDQEFDSAVDSMKKTGLNGLILDLRYNPGGLLDQAVAITSRFVDKAQVKTHNGMVVSTHAKDNALVQREWADKGAASLAGIPVAVLVNQGSASASEIVSGALQDYAKSGDIKAVIIGERSYGKGSVQNVWPLDRGNTKAYIKVTTQYYRLPDGRMIHRRPTSAAWGVDPDLKVDMLPNQISDALTIRLNADVPHIDDIRRMAGNPDSSSDADDLIVKGIDMQLEQAVVLLQTQVPAAVAGSGTVKGAERNN
jgi:carboxyl-terminal processing protease